MENKKPHYIIKKGVMSTNKNYEKESYDINIAKVENSKMLAEMLQAFYWECDEIFLTLGQDEIKHLSKETKEWIDNNV